MPVIQISDIPKEQFKGGSTYQTIVGDQQGSIPLRIGKQTCPPGYKTALHSHPYLETIIVLEGEGEAWIEGREELARLHRPASSVLFVGSIA